MEWTMQRFLFAAFLVAVFVGHSGPGSDVAAAEKCARAGAGYADGCAAAPATGQFLQPDFFSMVRQSGQSQYRDASGKRSDHPPPWDVAGVDYPVGHVTPDARLLDPIKNPPAGCTYAPASHWLRCPSGANIQHYRFNGVGIYVDKGALTLIDNHFTMTADNCQNYRGLAPVSIHAGESPLIATSNTFDFDGGCSIVASLYKQKGDPGLETQSRGTATITGNRLTYAPGSVSGTIRVGQYIDCDGCTTPAMITSGSDLTWSLDKAQPNLAPAPVTTGPVAMNANGALSGGGPITATYNADLGFGQFIGSGTLEDILVKYNYGKILSTCGQHVNFVINLPQNPGTMNNYIQDFNTVYWDKAACAPTGTGTIDQFVTGPASNTGTVKTMLSQSNNNVVISNLSARQGNGRVTAALFRILNQNGGVSANIDYTLSNGTLDVTALNKNGPLKVGDFIYCGRCSAPVRILAFGSGNGGTGTYKVSNTINAASEKNRPAYPFPGEIASLNWNENYVDATGANGAFFPDGHVPTGAINVKGNVDMLSGNACTLSSCR
jgi:hypothetical protein